MQICQCVFMQVYESLVFVCRLISQSPPTRHKSPPSQKKFCALRAHTSSFHLYSWTNNKMTLYSQGNINKKVGTKYPALKTLRT